MVAPQSAAPSLDRTRFRRWIPPLHWHSRLNDAEFVDRLRREEQRSARVRWALAAMYFVFVVLIFAVMIGLLQVVLNIAQRANGQPGVAAGLALGFGLGFIVMGAFFGMLMHLFHGLQVLMPDRQRRLLIKYHDAFHVARRQVESSDGSPAGD